MGATDRIHDQVKNALIKDGWTITHEPFTVVYEEVALFADLAAERSIAAERVGEQIVVEVKSFLGPSPVHELKIALGQYEMYRTFLDLAASPRKLYLAVSQDIHGTFFQQKAIQVVVQKLGIALLVVDIAKEEIVSWIN